MTPHEPVRLIHALAETPAPIPRLYDATAEPPRSGEAVVLDARGMTLAMASEVGRDCEGRRIFKWCLTGHGCQRIEREVAS